MDKGDEITPEVLAEVRRWVAATSARYVAEVTGVPRSVMATVVAGATTPHRATRVRLLEWYASRPPEPPQRTARAVTASADAPDVDFEAMRRLMRQRVEETSLRAFVRSCGLGRTTVAKFLDGSIPNRRTRPRFVAWYRQQVAAGTSTGGTVAYRDVPMGHLREFYRQIVAEDGIRLVAEASGVVRNTLVNFLKGNEPFAQTRRLLGLYYLYEKENGPERRQKIRAARRRPNRRPGKPQRAGSTH